MKKILIPFIAGIPVLTGCASPNGAIKDDALQAGFRYSSYGPSYNPGPEYWPYAGEQMAAKFPGSRPATLWQQLSRMSRTG